MSVPILKQADNGFWYAFWTDGRRSKRKSMGVKDQAVATARFAQWLLIDGQSAGAEEISYTVADLWQAYEMKHLPTVAAPITPKRSWAHLKGHFGDLMPVQVPDAVEGYIAKRARQGVLGSTIRRELIALRACLNWAADPRKGKMLTVPVPPFDMPPAALPRDRWLTQAEIDRLIAAAQDPRIALFIHLAIGTAGRKAALLDLTWDRVDFETKVVHLNDPSRRQTSKRRASVPISAKLLPVLQDAYARRRNDLVLTHKADPYHPILTVAKHAGVPGVSPHVFRHTAATHMARRGVPLWIIAKVLGNSLEMVERVYAKHAPDDLRSAVELITGEN